MDKAHVLLGQKGVANAIPFVLPRQYGAYANTLADIGYAAAPWVIEFLAWTGEKAPVRWHHCIYGLLLGYSASEIGLHDAGQFAGLPMDESTSIELTGYRKERTE